MRLTLPVLIGLLTTSASADIFWTGATSNDIFDETNWDLTSSSVTVIDPNVTINDNVVIANAAQPVEIPDVAGQQRFEVGDGFVLTLDNSTITVLTGNDGVGGYAQTLVGPTVLLINGAHLDTFFITNSTDLDVDASSAVTFGGPATPINVSTVNITAGSGMTFLAETPADYLLEHLSKTTVDGQPAVDGVNIQVVSDGGAGCTVSALPSGSGSPYCFGDGSGADCPCFAFGGTGEGCANTSGTGAIMAASGAPSFSFDSLQFQIDGVPGDKPGLILRADNQVATPIGDGILCAVGNSQRSQVQVTSAGSTTYTDWNGSPFGSVANAGGAPTNFQFWYRDPANACSGAGFNFTNAWTVTYAP